MKLRGSPKPLLTPSPLDKILASISPPPPPQIKETWKYKLPDWNEQTI